MEFRSTKGGVWGFLDIQYSMSRVPARDGDVVEYEGTIQGNLEGVSVVSIGPPPAIMKWEGPVQCAVDGNRLEFDFRFLKKGFEYEQGIVVALVSESGRPFRVKIGLGAPLWLEYIYNALETENDGNLVQNLISEFERRGDSIYSIVDIASKNLPREAFFRFCDLLVQHSDRFEENLPKNLLKYLHRLFEPDPKDPHAEGNRLEYLSAFNDTESFNADIDNIVSEVLEETIESKDLDDLVWFAERFGSDAYPVGTLSDLQKAVLLGVAVRNNISDQVELFLKPLSTVSVDEYESKKEAALNRPIHKRSRHLEELLYEAYRRDETEFRRFLTQYLVFLRNEYNPAEVPDGYFETILDVGADLAESQNLAWLKQVAEYSYAVEAGWRAMHKNQYHDAKAHFSEAVLIAVDPEGGWEKTTDFVFKAIRNLTEATIFEQRSKNKYLTAAEEADSWKTLLEDIDGVTDDLRYTSIRKIEGLYHESKGLHQASTQQYDGALDAFNSATAAFSRAGFDEHQDRCIAMRHEIMALQQELRANFDRASKRHDQFASQVEDHPAAEYHSVRAQICQVKEHMINDEIHQAISITRDIEREHYLNERQEQLADLLDIVEDYNHSNVTNFEDLRQPSLGIDTAGDYTVSFRDDYSVGIIAGLAAQRFATYQFPREMLDDLVTTALHQAVVPNTLAEISTEELSVRPKIRALDPSSDWQSQLPEHVLRQLNDINNREQQIRGDYTGLLRDLAVALEQHLAVVIDYIGTREVGSNWITELNDIDDPTTKPSLGHYLQFLETEIGNRFDGIDKIRDLIDNPIVGESRIDTLRNNLQHGYQPEIATDEGITRKQYTEIKTTVLDLMSNLILNTPIIAEIEIQHEFGDGYQVRLHWGEYLKRTWIKTNAPLSEGEIYYIPANEISHSEIDVLDPTDLIECTEQRTLSHI